MSGELLDAVVGFARELRGDGVRVETDRIRAFVDAYALLGPADAYWAGRATLLAREDDVPAYDAAFRRWWGDRAGGALVGGSADRRPRPVPGAREPETGERGGEHAPGAPRASRLEVLRRASFAELTPQELDELARLASRLARMGDMRRSRRRGAARRGALDVRRTVRRSLRTGGEPLHCAWRRRGVRRRRVILLLDVSRSMAAYSRGLLVFAHAALRADARWEAFCFATRLTRVTGPLARRDPAAAIAAAAARVQDWDGGTRIGDSLKRFLRDYGRGGLARGAVVVICSDGLEVGDPALLDEQLERLGRLAHRVVWLNPLREQPGYAPIARGMRAALPHLDTFASGHSFASLEEALVNLPD